MIHYFAYGSNMDKDDLDKWCIKEGYPIIEFLDIKQAKLSGFQLCFNYFSKSRKAGATNIMISKDSYVYGLLIKLQDGARVALRKKEGFKKKDLECLPIREYIQFIKDWLTDSNLR